MNGLRTISSSGHHKIMITSQMHLNGISAMTLFSSTTSWTRPRWDGSRILFEITEGNGQVPCAISRAALEEISERRCFKAADLLGCFAKARGRIERLALEKLRARPDGI